MWESIPLPKDEKGEVERVGCWDYVFHDHELAALVGNYNTKKGGKLIAAIKASREIDSDFSGTMSKDEFIRLADPGVIARSEASLTASVRAKVDMMWRDIPLPKDENGEVERVGCWEYVFADIELATLIGDCNKERGTK